MADFKTPNLCGANEALNNASSKINDIKAEIESKLDSAASEAAAAFQTAQADIKAGLDALAEDLPETPNVNFQSEITSLINNIDRSTVEGLSAYNAKLAQLRADFGDTLKEKGLDLDKLVSESSTRLGKDVSAAASAIGGAIDDVTGAVGGAIGDVTGAVGGAISDVTSAVGDAVSSVTGGLTGTTPSIGSYADDAAASLTGGAAAATGGTGNICDLVPNLEIPANVSGTGKTTKEVEDRISNAATLTLSQTPKEILEVQGKKTTQSFFTNIQYTLNGKIIVPKATGTYDTIKAKYTVSVIKEKPIAAKQADAPPEKEEVSTITKNVNVETIKTELKEKIDAVKKGTAFTSTTKKTNIVTSTGNVVKASTTKDLVTKGETGEKTRATKSEDGISGKYKIIKDGFYVDANITTHPFEEVQNEKQFKGKGKTYFTDLFKKKKYTSVTDLSDQMLSHEPIEIVSFFTMMWFLSPQSLNVGRKIWFVGYSLIKADKTVKTNIYAMKGKLADPTKQYDLDPTNPKRILQSHLSGETSVIAFNLKYKILDTTDSSYE